jgi:hypothetical protein
LQEIFWVVEDCDKIRSLEAKEDAGVKVFFGLPPPPIPQGMKNKFRNAVVVPVHNPEHPHDGNLVLEVRRPKSETAPAYDQEFQALASYSEGQDH